MALTGWGQDEDQRKSKDAGFDHHLVKPVDYEALSQILASMPSSGQTSWTEQMPFLIDNRVRVRYL